MRLIGNLQVASDKSITHRAIIFSSLAKGDTYIYNPLLGEDCLSTLEIFKKLGISYEIKENYLKIKSPGVNAFKGKTLELDANNSGTTARLLMGVFAALPLTIKLTGDTSLSKRPMRRVKDPLSLMGAKIELTNELTLPAIIEGASLTGITYELPVASAQVKSALMLAGIFAKGTTVIGEPILTRDHTEKMFEAFKIIYNKENHLITIPGLQQPKTPGNLQIPADISSAAFFIVAALMLPGSDITLKNVGLNESRAGILDVVKEMKGNIQLLNQSYFGGEPIGDIRIRYTKELIGTTISGDLIPKLIDEIPIIALLATKAKGLTLIKDAQELKVKETNRIETTVTELKKLGAELSMTEDGMIIQGKHSQKYLNSNVQSYEDHRIAMMLSIASLLTEKPLKIKGIEAMSVSYPDFLKHLEQLKID